MEEVGGDHGVAMTVEQQLAGVAEAAETIPQTSFIHGTNPREDDDDESVVAVPDHSQVSSGGFPVDDPAPAATKKQKKSAHKMSPADVEICQRLDAEYERALEEREVAYAARYNSVRQSACFAVIFMVVYMTLGTIYFMRQADWTVEESLFFGVSTLTTVGYGNLDTPETPAFQIYTIFFILIGIATLTIMVAQVYQCVALEAGRAQHSRDQHEMMRRGLDVMAAANDSESNRAQQALNTYYPEPMVDRCIRCFDRTKIFLNQNEIGKGLSVVLPFAVLILVGAVVVGFLEGWGPIEAVYFSVVSLTTVGFGDYYPSNRSSRLFCILWLPFSIGFMSLYLGNIAAFYIRLSDRNIARIERHLRRRIDSIKALSEREREAARQRALRGQSAARPTSSGGQEDQFSVIPPVESSYGRDGAQGQERRKRVMENFLNENSPVDGSGDQMTNFKDILNAIHFNMQNPDHSTFKHGPESEYLSFRSSRLMHQQLQKSSVRKPSFALRVLVQERLAEIIAEDVAGYQDHIEIVESTLTVSIDSLRQTSEKWLIPRRARRAFRAACFEALYFVGEHGLITRGADALFSLNPFEFHALFAPVLAALGDADTMEGWLASTEILATADLRKQQAGAESKSEPSEKAIV
mmetsp:Transcript_8953/g.20223  ORF Transcript_8953/g.20223 Transcript_8953/m.20223 type:complete len:637 (-) Transcript_8953:1508-3418(-)